MLLNLKQIGAGASYDEKTLEFSRSLDLSAVKLWGEHPFSAPVNISGVVSCRSGIYMIRYSANFEMSGACSRCLVPINRAFSRDFEHTVLVESDSEDISDEYILAENGMLDLDELVTSDLLLDLDGVMLCRDDCPGLCPKCGKNLNEGGCSCDLREPDPRFDVLRKLLSEE